MEFIHERNRVYAKSESGQIIAEITFPSVSDNTVNIDHTYVDPTLRGQGIADQLIRKAVDCIKASGLKATASCSYAKRWLAEHPEYAEIMEK